MTCFEEGYKAFLDGRSEHANPYDFDECPYSFKQWLRGWKACQAYRREVMR